MAGPFFDVYLIGAKDSGPSAQMRLAASIAARYRLSALAVAEAFEGVPCRVGGGLVVREAQTLADTLATMGAIAQIAPTGVPFDASGSSARLTTSTAPSWPTDAFMGIPAAKDRRITLKSTDADPPLVVDLAAPIEFAEAGPEGRTGVRGPDTVRCPIHGFVYSRRNASGCLKCLAAARAQARQIQEERTGRGPAGPVAGSSVRDNPVARAFWGLAVALLAGFLPATVYARRFNRSELRELRARQAEISAQPATQESLARFDALDAAVDASHRRGAGCAFLIWVAGTGIVGVAWTRFTRPRSVDG
jgi:hypothetical protein